MLSENEVMVWVDMETTGLESELDVPLELGIILTDPYLNIIGEWSSLIRHEQWEGRLEDSVPWVKETHNKSGLVDEIKALPEYRRSGSQIRGWQPYDVALMACEWLSEHDVPEGLPMCGSTVHFDRRFLDRYMKILHVFFGYRNIDVSTLTELCKLVNPGLYARCKEIPEFDKKNAGHRVLSDLRYSIKKMRFWMDEFLIVGLPYPDENQPEIYGLNLADTGGPMLGAAGRCPTCDAPSPILHPSLSGGGEVVNICNDQYHKS